MNKVHAHLLVIRKCSICFSPTLAFICVLFKCQGTPQTKDNGRAQVTPWWVQACGDSTSASEPWQATGGQMGNQAEAAATQLGTALPRGGRCVGPQIHQLIAEKTWAHLSACVVTYPGPGNLGKQAPLISAPGVRGVWQPAGFLNIVANDLFWVLSHRGNYN